MNMFISTDLVMVKEVHSVLYVFITTFILIDIGIISFISVRGRQTWDTFGGRREHIFVHVL